MVDLALGLIGIVIIVKGNIKVSKKSQLTSTGGRILGVVLLLPFIVHSLIMPTLFGSLAPDERAQFIYLDYIIYGAIILAIIIISLLMKESIGEAAPQEAHQDVNQ